MVQTLSQPRVSHHLTETIQDKLDLIQFQQPAAGTRVNKSMREQANQVLTKSPCDMWTSQQKQHNFEREEKKEGGIEERRDKGEKGKWQRKGERGGKEGETILRLWHFQGAQRQLFWLYCGQKRQWHEIRLQSKSGTRSYHDVTCNTVTPGAEEKDWQFRIIVGQAQGLM